MNPKLIPNVLRLLKGGTSSPTVENPYNSAACCQNLRAYLQTLCSFPYSGHLLVGEAPGHKGCALTGIPFTSQRVLSSSDHPFIEELQPLLSVSGSVTEATATIVWDYLRDCTVVPAMWNVFPFHPHKAGTPRSNRTPTTSEVHSGQPYLKLVFDILSPHKVICVGGTSAKTLAQLFPNLHTVSVRHPSFGGKAEFIAGIEAAGIM